MKLKNIAAYGRIRAIFCIHACLITDVGHTRIQISPTLAA